MSRTIFIILFLFSFSFTAWASCELLLIRDRFKNENEIKTSFFRGVETTKVRYFSEDIMHEYKLQFEAGLIMHKGEALTYRGIYVVNDKDEILIEPFISMTDLVHHSSLVSGGGVKCAGHISIKDGTLYYLDNLSGHYIPPNKNLDWFIGLLKQNGIDTSNALIEYKGSVFDLLHDSKSDKS